MTAKRNRTPWIIVGGLGCLGLCLLMVLAGGSVYLLWGSARATPVANTRWTPSAIPLTPTPSPPKHYDHAEFTFDYPGGYETFADFWPTSFGFSYKPGRNKEFDADELGGVLLPFTSLTPVDRADKYLTSVKIYRRALPPGSSLKELYEQAYSEQTYSGGYAKSNSVSDRTVTVDGVAALEKVYRKPEGPGWYQLREVWLEESGLIFIISCRTLPSWFDEHQPGFNMIVDSFHVK